MVLNIHSGCKEPIVGRKTKIIKHTHSLIMSDDDCYEKCQVGEIELLGIWGNSAIL